MALRVEARFTDKSDFVNNRKDFIAKDNPVSEIDSAISLDFADSLDNISDFEGELKSATAILLVKFQVQAQRSIYDSDDSDYGYTVKERSLQLK